MIRSRRGYLWLSGNGIYRFDGKHYVHYSKLNNSASGLRDNRITGIEEDENGRIWFAGIGGICYYNDSTDKFTYLDLDAQRKIRYAGALYRTGKYLWFTCGYGLCKLNTQTLKIETTAFAKNIDCVAICATDSNTLWLCDWGGEYYIYHMQTNSYQAKRLHGDYDLAIWGIAQNDRQVWLSTYDGLWVAQHNGSEPQQVKGTEGMHAGAIKFVPALTGDSILWIGTGDKDLRLYNINTGKIIYHYLPDPNNPYSILGRFVNNIYVDNQQIIWLCTEKGLSSLNYRNQFFKTQILPENMVFRIAQDSADKNVVWMSGLEHGLTKVDWSTKQVMHNYFHFNSCGGDQKNGSNIMNMYQVDKYTWLLSTYQTMFTWNSQTGKERIVSGLPARYFINYKRDSLIIVSTDSIYLCALPSCTVKTLCGDYFLNDGEYDGRRYLWIPTGNGLLKYDPLNNNKKRFQVDTTIGNGHGNAMMKAVIDKRGRVICGTRCGIAIFDTATQQFTFVESFGGILHPDCYDIKIRDSLAFINTNGGHICLNLNTRRSFLIPLRDKDNFSDRPIGEVNNEIVLGLKYEYAYFDPVRIVQQPVPSAPIIEKIKIEDKFIYYPGNGRVLSLPYYRDQLAFYFTAFEFQNPDQVQFRYMVDGLDTAWSYTSGLREVSFMRIPPGYYTFRVQSGNSKGEWNDLPATLSFEIAHPYWQTWWFRLALVLALGGVLYSVYRYRINNIQEMENVRKKIAADFHDDLGSTLSSISIYSEVARKSSETNLPRTNQLLTEIGEKTRSIIVSMNDMIWSVKPDNDTLKKLVEYMQEFGVPVTEASDMQLVFQVAGHLPDLKLNMITRKNIYYIYKEALNNALKYSGATRITISFEKHRGGYMMEVTDNGKGFDIDGVKRGNGLGNIAKRVKEMNGRVEILSKPGEGTNIKCFFKIA